MDYSHPLFIIVRRVGQKIGILRPMQRIWRKIFNSAYEDGFDKYMLSKIKPNQIVWDVGANVGYFTEKFLFAVGPYGSVVAFEPSPGCVNVLRDKFSTQDNVLIEPIGLSDNEGISDFSIGEGTDPTNGLGVRAVDKAVVKVTISTGDIYVDKYGLRIPNYIKIDVEGYELEVINGLSKTLRADDLKGVFIEMHFLELAKRGLPHAPAIIVQVLQEHGLRIRWLDPSHLAAERD